ncbi:MAG TPA: DUF4843 domain-containing protein [Chitinophaga sp.]
MKKTIHCLSILFPALLLLAAGCKKENIPAGGNYQDAVYFVHALYDENPDSLNYSFVSRPDSITLDTIWLPVRIAGNTAPADRAISMTAVDTATTAVAGKDYQLLQYVMPKGYFTTQLGIILYRTPALQNTTLQLTVQLQPNSGFPALMKDTASANGRMFSRNTYRITFTDQLVKPANWDSFLVYLFGTYNKVKYRFIIEVTGRTDFPVSGAGAMSYGQLLYYQGILKTALSNYNAAHGNLTDENGNPVTIP